MRQMKHWEKSEEREDKRARNETDTQRHDQGNRQINMKTRLT